MARELSQAELLDFLCQAGGRVTNAALLGHFQRFLREPGPAGQVQRRREQFKGFVNAVATVRQEAGGPKYVVLRKRYRDFLGQASGGPGGLARERLQEPPPPAASSAAASPAPRRAPGQPHGPCAPAPPLPSAPGCGRPPPVFRSIRCRLALPDLEAFGERASPGRPEDGGSRREGRDAPQEAGDRCAARRASDGPGGAGLLDSRGPPLSNGWPSQRPAQEARGPVPCPRDPGLRRGHRSFRSRSAPGGSRTSSSEDEPTAQDQERRGRRPPRPRKLARGAILAPPAVDAPIPSQHLGPGSCVPAEEALPAPRLSSVPLGPREHKWVVLVAAGSWVQVRALLLEDPQLALQRDFISGYTALHWIAKHGANQVLQDFISGAEKAGVRLDVNVKSSCGYTPLHLAAIHGHQRVIMLLVQKLKSQVHLRDSSGKRPWQYLSSSTSGEVWQLLGAPKGKTIFPTQPLVRHTSPPSKAKSQEVVRSISRKTSLAACLKPQHMKWKMATKYPALREQEEYSD